VTVTITYCLNAAGKCLSEVEIAAGLAQYAAALRKNSDLEGYLIITAPGQPEIQIEDTLEATVQNLCFKALDDLVKGASVAIPYFSMAGTIHVRVEGNMARVEGDYIDQAQYPLRELIEALYACGHRFLEMLRVLYAGDTDFQPRLAWLAPFEAKAKQQLAG
jgi:hypothetical protein